MGAQDYSKHKDRDPQQTVAAIRAKLASMGIETDLAWTSHQFDGTWSCRVTITGTSLGTNGKGTSQDYAMASGYAELLERIQNKGIGHRTHIEASFATHGFYDFPDERMVTAIELVERHDPVIDAWLEGWGCETDAQKIKLVREYSHAEHRREDDLVVEVPFTDVAAGRLHWLPPALYRRIYSSNGMCAGNTIEECLVQGLSEVFERHVRIKVLDGDVVMPRIPREELRAWSVGALIDRIEGDGRYRVFVFDGSLGKGYPVVVTVIADRSRGTFGVNCGAHPSMAVAVERTLTEAFQGRTAEIFSGINHLASLEEARRGANRHGVLVNGIGVYPTTLLVGEPGWEYVPWESDEGCSNLVLLRRMVDTLRREGFSPLVRNNSHLGFPTCQVIVPGMSETEHLTPGARERTRVRQVFSEALRSYPELSVAQQEAFLRAEGEDGRPIVTKHDRPFRGFRMRLPYLWGSLHLARGEYGAARRDYELLAKGMGQPAALFWQSMADYAYWRSLGSGRAEALELIETLYPQAFRRRVERETERDAQGSLAESPRMSCYDCANCALGEAGQCLGASDAAAFAKIDEAFACSQVSQEAFLVHLQELLG